MKNYKISIFVLVILVSFISFITLKEDKIVTSEINEPKSVEAKKENKLQDQNISMLRGPSQATKSLAQVKNHKKQKKLKNFANILDKYERETYQFKGMHVSHVRELQAVRRKASTEKEILTMGGFYIYGQGVDFDKSHMDQAPLAVVYDHNANAYGFFTGEVSIQGDFSNVYDQLQSLGIEIVYENLMEQLVIVKVMADDLDQLGKIKTSAKFKADIKTSLLRPM
jgi:hypothetical protein